MRELNPVRRNNTVTEEEISAVENLLQIKFSEEYREFIEKYNGGLFKEQLIEFDNDETNVIFLGIDGEKDLIHINELYAGRIPTGVIVIGMDPGGDLVCLSLNKSCNFNAVYYWRAEEENSGQSIEDLIKISESFFSFVDMLVKDE